MTCRRLSSLAGYTASFLIAGLLLVSTTFAQEISLTEETKLYAEPRITSKVKATLPVGLILTRISTQGDWTAVSTKEGLAGWIRSLGAEPESSAQDPEEEPVTDEETDDLLDSIRDAARETDRPDGASQGDDIPTSAGDRPPSPADEQADRPGAPADADARASDRGAVPPPPPPAAPPANHQQERVHSTPDLGTLFSRQGLYNASQWIKLGYRVGEDIQSVRATWGKLLNALAELDVWMDGSVVDGGGNPAPQDEIDFFGTASKAGITSRIATPASPHHEPHYVLEGGLGLDLYLVQPSASMPVGVFVGGVGSFGRYFGEEVQDVDLQVGRYGGGGGIYAHIDAGNGRTLIIPRAEIHYLQNVQMIDDDSFSDSSTLLRLGLDARLGFIVPGVEMAFQEDHRSFSFSLTFAR